MKFRIFPGVYLRSIGDKFSVLKTNIVNSKTAMLSKSTIMVKKNFKEYLQFLSFQFDQ